MVGWDKGVALLVMMWLRVRKERRERGGDRSLGFPLTSSEKAQKPGKRAGMSQRYRS